MIRFLYLHTEAAEVLLSNDGTMAYTTVNQNSADNTVSFTDIPALNDSTQVCMLQG